jgi:hypothetical protein
MRRETKMAETEGFEPSIQLYNPYNRRLQPLGHVSERRRRRRSACRPLPEAGGIRKGADYGCAWRAQQAEKRVIPGKTVFLKPLRGGSWLKSVARMTQLDPKSAPAAKRG